MDSSSSHKIEVSATSDSNEEFSFEPILQPQKTEAQEREEMEALIKEIGPKLPPVTPSQAKKLNENKWTRRVIEFQKDRRRREAEDKLNIEKGWNNWFPELKGKPMSEILSTALKTPLSEMIRKGIEAQKRASEDSNESSTSDSKTNSAPANIGDSSKSNDNGVANQQTSSVAENGQTLESKTIERDRTQSGQFSNKEDSTTRHCIKAPFSALRSFAVVQDTKILSNTESKLLADSKQISMSVSDACGDNINVDSTVKERVGSSEIPLPQKEKSSKSKRHKKRHFKGATYNLYLTPNKKKRKQAKQHDANSKDDEVSLTSTENGNDSSDASDSLSEDFNISEKSVPDDEACSNSRCSSIVDMTSSQGLTSTENNAELLQNASEPECENSSDCLVKNEWNIVDAVKQEDVAALHLKSAFNDGIDTFTSCKSSEYSSSTPRVSHIIKLNSRKSLISSDSSVLLIPKIEKTDYLNLKPSPSTSESVFEQRVKKEPADLEETADLTANDDEDDGISMILHAISKANVQANTRLKYEDSSMPFSVSTIATSVKSRQRMKRRFTDDVVDTDVGLLSLNSLPLSCRKAKHDCPRSLQMEDSTESFKIFSNAEAHTGPFPNTFPVLSSKLRPIDHCTCTDDTSEMKLEKKSTTFLCQAVDTYDDTLVGCSNPVFNFELVRPSVRVPLTVMCEMHLWRLLHHQCCPRCGVFCTQGLVYKCSSVKEKDEVPDIHLFHDRCQISLEEGKMNFCLHCGKDTNLTHLYISCELASPPAFFQSQMSMEVPRQARMCLRTTYPEQPLDSNEKKYEIAETGRILSSESLPEKEMSELEQMLLYLKRNDGDIATPHYPPAEFYAAASEGDVKKLLFMLAKGFNANEKFLDHDDDTALHAAALYGNIVIIHLLLQAGAEIDAMNRNLRTALMLAAENNKCDAVQCLLNRFAPVNTKGEIGMTALHIASRDGYYLVVEILLKASKVEVNLLDDGGWTPVVWASEHGHRDIVKILVEHGGNPNIRDNEGNTALHWAAFCGVSNVCTVLLDAGCILDEANNQGDTALHIASRQDNFDCVDLFLARSANVMIFNVEGEQPIDCCRHNPSCRSYRALKLNMSLKEAFNLYHHKAEKVLCTDITLGREKYPIRCINGVDDEKLSPSEFLYITKNCETCVISIDRCITSLQHCKCTDDCSAYSSCTCCAISFKCWYDKDGRLLPEFNMLDPPLLFECNRACSCNAGICRNRVVQRGMTARLELIRTEGRGWGVRALKDIPKGTFICEYVGELISDSEADTREDDSYLFDLDNKDGETYCLDARHFGNISRFINHLCEPNLIPVKIFINHQDLNFPRIAFFSFKDIEQYEELGFDYGEKFWVIKSKSFTCNCGSPKCKYSKDTIQTTLRNYNVKVSNELVEANNSFAI